MTRNPDQRSLDEVKELLRSLEDLTADDGAEIAPRLPPKLQAASIERDDVAAHPLPPVPAQARPQTTGVTPDKIAFMGPEKPATSTPASRQREAEAVPLRIVPPAPIPPPTVPSRATLGAPALSASRSTEAHRSRAGLISLSAGFMGFGAAVAIWYALVGGGDALRSFTARSQPKATETAPVEAPSPVTAQQIPRPAVAGDSSEPADSSSPDQPPSTTAFVTPAAANEPAPERVVRVPTPASEKGLPSSTPTQPTTTPARPPAGATETRTGLRMPPSIDVEVGEGRPLPIAVEPPEMRGSGATIVIMGLPQGATFNVGRTVQDGVWSVPIAEAGGLKLSVNEKSIGSFELTFDLRSSASSLLATGRTNLRVARRPLPTGVAISDPVRLEEAELVRLLSEGRKQLAGGHVASARLVLQRAADSGSGEAARMLGDTWDPAKLFTMGVRGITGDIERAIHWYERADELGDPQAKARLLALGR